MSKSNRTVDVAVMENKGQAMTVQEAVELPAVQKEIGRIVTPGRPAPPQPAVALPPSDADDPFMSLSEVARYLGKSPQTVMRWAADGLLETVRVGPLPKIRRSTLAKFLGGTALQPKVG